MEETPQAAPETPHVSGWALAVLSTALVLPCYFLFGGAAQLANPAFGLWFTEAFVFFGVPLVLLQLAGREPRGYTGAGRLTWKQAALGFGFGIANFFAWVIPIQFVALKIFPESWQQKYDVSQIFNRQSGLELALLIASVVIAAPVGEEFFFRGVLLRATHQATRRTLGPLLLSAAVFSAFHMDPVGFAGRVQLGVLFGWLYLRSGSLWPSVFAHAANNALATSLYFIGKRFGPDTPEDPDLLQVLIFTSLGIAVFVPLWRAIERNTALLGPSATEDRPRRPTPPLLPWVGGWFLAAIAAVAVIVAV
ncbi:MAG: lysostaphin resistance A-like protein, partial [Myxococcaceae bacterium]